METCETVSDWIAAELGRPLVPGEQYWLGVFHQRGTEKKEILRAIRRMCLPRVDPQTAESGRDLDPFFNEKFNVSY